MVHGLLHRRRKCGKRQELSRLNITLEEDKGRWHSGWRFGQYSRYAQGKRATGWRAQEGHMVAPRGAGDTDQEKLGGNLAGIQE